MRFFKTELELLRQFALGVDTIFLMSKKLKKDKSQIYRIIKSLEEKGFVKLSDNKIKVIDGVYVKLLLQELSRQPSFIDNLSGCGMEFYNFIIEPKTVGEIIKATGIKRSTVFYKIKKALKNNFIIKVGKKYQFNGKLWFKIKDFFLELKKYEVLNDKRVPPGSIIYYKTKSEILFSTKSTCDAILTGFSAYKDFGINILTIDNTYYLPKKKLTKKDVFLHSLYRVKKDMNVRNLIILSLFYVKYKKDLMNIPDLIIDNIDSILKGKKIEGYPSLSEIKDRLDVYDIKINLK